MFSVSVKNSFRFLENSDIFVFESIIENYCKNIVHFESNLELYKKLYEIFLLNLLWRKEKLAQRLEFRF